MDEREALRRLRNVLADLYSDIDSIRRITYDAGLDTSYILFGNGVNTWHTLLLEAKKHGLIEEIIKN